MKRIDKLKIKNFKAFKEEEIFNFKGKNVLVYGNNGSGKSSLFWALYTFLQSSIKSSDEEIEKYFEYFDSANARTHQSLLNLFMPENEDACIEMSYIDMLTQEIHTNTISKDTINTRNNSVIKELNLSSDFINYKLLHNFYNASHRQEVNLWSVFERDIFPFISDEISEIPWLSKIKSITIDVPRTPRNYLKTGRDKTTFLGKINNLNTEIETLLHEIETNANYFLKEHFFEGKDRLKISLKFEKQFNYDKIKNKLWKDNQDTIRHSLLQIKLMVELYNEKVPEWKEVHRVQSFLNEAQLTRIAIAIRIGALRTRSTGTDFKILVLDDMLNSLDMLNRVDVIRIILNKENKNNLKYFDDYQKIILTHDKGFYNLIHRHTDDKDWVYYKFIKDETKNDAPTIIEDMTAIQKSQKYFEEGEYEISGNELRKEAEAIMSNFLDPAMKQVDNDFEGLSDKLKKAYNIVSNNNIQKFKKLFMKCNLDINVIKKITEEIDLIPVSDISDTDRRNLKKLKSDLFKLLIEQYETKHLGDNRADYIEKTKEMLDRVMNNASHHSHNPLHRGELKKAIKHIEKLKKIMEVNY